PAMLATLLPISKAPISCSRSARRRLTVAASALPWLSNRSMDARDDAVRAVSLPENRKEISRHSTTARMITRSTVVMVQGLPWDGGLYPDHPNRAQILKSRRSNLSALLRQKSTNLGSIDVI